MAVEEVVNEVAKWTRRWRRWSGRWHGVDTAVKEMVREATTRTQWRRRSGEEDFGRWWLLGSMVATDDDAIAPVATVFLLFQVNGFKNIYYPLN
jgi:hypothetical protein